MKNAQSFLWALLVLALVSCSKEKPDESAPGTPQTLLEQIKMLGFSPKDIVEHKDYYLVEGDIMFLKNDTENKLKQARTNFVVANGYRKVKVYLNTGSFSVVNLSSALSNAINAYNALGIGITFTQVSTVAESDISIDQAQIDSYTCALSGFPSANGRPFGQIYVSEAILTQYGATATNQLTFLLAHEIGHCIGLRHTNWAQNGESANPYGALQIAGTPSVDQYSLMNSGTCGFTWSGFSSYDKTALSTLYPKPWRWIVHSSVGSGWPADWIYLTGDFTGDKVTDIVVRKTDAALAIYPWTGTTWGTIRNIGSGWPADWIYLTGDFTGDKITDIVVRKTDAALAIYPWTGTTWGSIRDIGSGWPADWIYLTGDFTGDGITDIVVRKTDAKLAIYPWTGTTWGSIRDIGSGWPADWVYLPGDYTGDGITDILVRETDGTMRLYPWNGSSWGDIRDVATGWNYNNYFASDFTGDGLTDVMVRNSAGDMIFYQWNGTSFTSYGVVGTGWNFTHYFAKDFNNDGRSDFMVRDASGYLHFYEWRFNN